MKKFLVILLLSVFSLSCTLDVHDKPLSSSLSFVLPYDNVTRSGGDETSYNVLLMYGENKKDGKAFENNYKGGDKVIIKGLKPGLYTLIIKGENETEVLEGEKTLEITSGENKTSIMLSKKAKANVVLDLTNISLEPSITFNVEVKDINNKVIVDRKNQSYTSSYTIPYNFNAGSYFITFSTNNLDNEKYYLDNASPLVITNDKITETPYTYTLSVSSRPIKEFFVDTSALDKGDGSKALPFNSLSKALDVVLSSSDIKKDDIRINVKGEVRETNPILIDKNANITIRGEGSDITTIVTYFNVKDATLTLSNMTLMPDRQTGKRNTVCLNNSTLIIDKDLITKDIEMNNGSLIRLNSTLPVDSAITLHLDTYEENRKVLEKSISSLNFNGFLLEDLYFDINPKGLVKKTREKVTLTFIKEVVNKNYEVKYFDENGESNPLQILNKEVVMEDFFDIGKEYVFTLYTNTPTTSLQKIEEKRLTISKNFNENCITFLELNDIYVDFDLGSDTAFNGEEKNTPYKTLDKAIQRIKTSPSTNPIKIHLTGNTLSESSTNIENIESLVLKTENSSIQQNKKAYINSLNVTSSNVKMEDVNAKKVILNNSNLTLSNTSSTESLYINEIYLKDENSLVKVEGELPTLSKKIVIDLDSSLYVEGKKIIDTSVSKNLSNFTLKNEQYKIGENGEIKVNSNLNLILDKNIEQGRYECNIYDKETSNLLKTLPLNDTTTSIPFFFNEGQSYELKIIDTSDYQKVKAIRNIIGSKEKKDININLNRTLYVSNGGDDTNSGESENNTLLTLNNAISKLTKKANGDMDNEYQIIMLGEKTTGSLSSPLISAGNIEINDAIKLTIKGKGEEDPRVTPLRCVLESSSTTPLIVINNENAIVQIDNLALKIKGSGSSSESESLIDVRKGHLKVLSNVSFEREGLIDKTLLKIGSNGFVTLSNAQKAKEDTFLNKIYVENRSVNAPFIFLEEGFADKGSDIYNPIKYTPYDVILSSSYSQSLYPKVVKNINDRPLSEEKTLIFNVSNDLYINNSGELTNKIAFKYNLTNVPGADGDTTVTSRNYSLYIYNENEEQIHETQKISKALNNETVLKVVPSQTLHIVIKDNEVLDKNNAPLIISDNNVEVVNGVTEVPLYEVAIKNTSSKNNIKDALTYLSKANQGASPITDPINITLKLNNENYIEGEWSFNTTKGSINVPENISFNIKKDEKSEKAKIVIDDKSSNPNVLIIEAKPTTLRLSFEGIDFESKETKETGYALNLDGGGTFSFKDVSYSSLGKTAFIRVCLFYDSQNTLTRTNVELGGKIDMKNGSYIYLTMQTDRSNPFGGGANVCPTLVISSSITAPSPIPITIRDLNGGKVSQTPGQQILKIKDGSGVILADELKKFTLKQNPGTITNEGIWQ